MFQPGDFGLSHSGTKFSWLIAFLQCLIGDASRYTHAFIIFDAETALEADRDHGVIKKPLAEYRNVVYVHSNLTDAQRKIILAEAESFLGAAYGWINYIGIGLMRMHKCPRWLTNKITKNNKFVCSQLVCHVYEKAGVQLLGPAFNWLNTTPGRLSYIIGENNA